MDTSIAPESLVDPHSLRQPLDLQRAAKITAGVGILHAILLLAAFIISWRTLPRLKATDADYQAFFADDSKRRLVLFAGLYLIPFAGIAYIWFTVALRAWLQGAVTRLNRLFADILLVCGIIYVTLLFCDGAAISVVSIDFFANNDQIMLSLARQFPHYGASLFLIFAMRMAAMSVFALSNIARSTTYFPRWFIYSGFVVGVALLLTASLNPILVAVFPLWLIVFCVLVIRQVRRLPAASEPSS